MKFITNLVRVLVGTLFIFSGYVKAVDPKGTAIKLEEYFHVFSEYLPALDGLWHLMANLALPFSIFMIVLEIVMGVALLLGYKTRLTLFTYAVVIIFFTVLTGFSAITGKVTDCGCFGDFLKLEPLTSFLKDVVLCILIIILFAGAKHIKPIFKSLTTNIIMLIALIITTAFTLRNHVNLPMSDFRPYKVGTDLDKGRQPGDPGEIVKMYTLKNQASGEVKQMSDKEYMDTKIWEDKNWQIQKDLTESVVIREPELPKIKDFIIFDRAGNDVADSLLQISGYHIFVPAYNLDKASKRGLTKINTIIAAASKDGVGAAGLTSTDLDVANKLTNGTYKFYNLDATPIKTMIRSNPGLVLMKGSVLVDKWHYNFVPSWEEIKKEHRIQ